MFKLTDKDVNFFVLKTRFEAHLLMKDCLNEGVAICTTSDDLFVNDSDLRM